MIPFNYPFLMDLLEASTDGLFEWLPGYLPSIGYPTENLIFNKGGSRFIVAVPETFGEEGLYSPVCLVAHCDTISRPNGVQLVRIGSRLMNAKGGCLGADDRAGVFVMLEAARHATRKPILVFTDEEESGGRGAKQLVREDALAPFSDYINLFIEYDRKGWDQYVFYTHSLPDDVKALAALYGYRQERGSYSDVADLSDAYGLPHLNLSVGYWNQHTANEYLELNALKLALKSAERFLADTEIPRVEMDDDALHGPKYGSYGGSYGSYGGSYGHGAGTHTGYGRGASTTPTSQQTGQTTQTSTAGASSTPKTGASTTTSSTPSATPTGTSAGSPAASASASNASVGETKSNDPFFYAENLTSEDWNAMAESKGEAPASAASTASTASAASATSEATTPAEVSSWEVAYDVYGRPAMRPADASVLLGSETVVVQAGNLFDAMDTAFRQQHGNSKFASYLTHVVIRDTRKQEATAASAAPAGVSAPLATSAPGASSAASGGSSVTTSSKTERAHVVPVGINASDEEFAQAWAESPESKKQLLLEDVEEALAPSASQAAIGPEAVPTESAPRGTLAERATCGREYSGL